MTEGSLASTRLRTLLEAEACSKRVVWPAPMLNCCQLMMAPLLLVTVRTLPACTMAAVPLTTCAPTGRAKASAEAKQAAIARHDKRRRMCIELDEAWDRQVRTDLDKANLPSDCAAGQ